MIIQERYEKEALPALKEKLGKANRFSLPRISHVVVHSGIGKHRTESGFVDDVQNGIRAITGQQPAERKARKSIAGFKLRQGQLAGLMVTLRGKRMEAFLDRLVHIVLPRVRDFRGLSENIVDDSGNVSIGIRDVSAFPEITAEGIDRQFGLQITVITTANNKKEARMLLSALGFPFAKEEE